MGEALSRSRASRNAALSSGFNDEPEHFLCPGNQGVVMAGKFELFRDGGVSFRFRLKAPNGTVVAVSKQYSDKASAVEGIHAVRECAGTGLITDLCPPMPRKAVKKQAPLPVATAV
ncbi:YegP family protein [Arthrobacter sp. PL16]|uniref:YegP family protein n=1 Tax=Arthrobacter sp. PL16 TaxID=3071720 RepID=UPI002E13835A